MLWYCKGEWVVLVKEEGESDEFIGVRQIGRVARQDGRGRRNISYS